MTYKILKAGWIHPVGSIISHDELPEGRDAESLIQKGIMTPHDGSLPVAADDNDAKNWKARAEALELENIDLRNASVDAEKLARLSDLEKEQPILIAKCDELQARIDTLSGSVVPMDQYRQIEAELNGYRNRDSASASTAAPAEAPSPAEAPKPAPAKPAGN